MIDYRMPPVNAEYLHARLPRAKLDLIDDGPFIWEDAADEYASIVTTWWDTGLQDRLKALSCSVRGVMGR